MKNIFSYLILLCVLCGCSSSTVDAPSDRLNGFRRDDPRKTATRDDPWKTATIEIASSTGKVLLARLRQQASKEQYKKLEMALDKALLKLSRDEEQMWRWIKYLKKESGVGRSRPNPEVVREIKRDQAKAIPKYLSEAKMALLTQRKGRLPWWLRWLTLS